jgi:DNA-binding NarL/FixJ family response regulator
VTVTVVVADDQAMVRAGFRRLLDAEPDIDVVGEANDGGQAVDLVDRLRPQVALLDIRMPNMDGIEATRRITAVGTTRVVILTTFDLDEYVYDALRAGASGFLLKDAPPEQMIAGVHAAASGDALIAPSVTRRLLDEFAQRPQPADASRALASLTERERDILLRLGRGRSNAEIAATLYMSVPTVKTHVSRILAKLDLNNRVQIALLAHDAGLLDEDEPM